MAGTTSNADKLDIIVQITFKNPDARQQQLIENCHNQLQKMESEAISAAESDLMTTYETVGKALSDAVEILGQSDGGKKVLSVISLISNLASLTGPTGALVGAICTVLSNIITTCQCEEENLLSKIGALLNEELQGLKFDMLEDEGSGLIGLGERLIKDAQYYLNQYIESGTCEYKGLELRELNREYDFMCKLKTVAEKQFAALVEECGDIDCVKSVNAAQRCLMCLVSYSNIATIHITILSLYKTLSNNMQFPTGIIDSRLEEVKHVSKELLRFLSDRDLVGPVGWWKGKLRVMEMYRKMRRFFVPIERFRRCLDLPLTNYSCKHATLTLEQCLEAANPKKRSCCGEILVPKFSNDDAGRDTFDRTSADDLRHDVTTGCFCLVNNTRWPICVFSTSLSLMNKRAEVQPHSTLTDVHVPWYIPTGQTEVGVITVGESLKDLCEMKDVQLIGFAYSIPTRYDVPKAIVKILSSNDESNLTRTREELGKASRFGVGARSFKYDQQFCIVKSDVCFKESTFPDPMVLAFRSHVNMNPDWIQQQPEMLSRPPDYSHRVTMYRYFIEEFDDDKLKQQTASFHTEVEKTQSNCTII